MKAFIVAIFASLSLVACGGGGGGPIPQPVPSVHPQGASLGVGFIGAKNSALSVGRKTKDVSPVITGALLPFATFTLPDQTVKNASGLPTLGYTAVAYLDTSNGSTLPSPLPTATFAITSGGNTGITLGNVLAVPTPNPALKKNTIGAQDLSQPTNIGTTVITATATGGYGSINLTANTYYGLALNVQNPGQYNVPAGNLSSVSFDSNGQANEDGGANGAPDLTITLDSNGVTTLSAPNGIMVQQEPLSLATASQFSKASAAKSVAGNTICVQGQTDVPQNTTYLIGTKAGGVVAWQLGDTGTETFADNNCDWTSAYGPYTKLQ